MAASVDVLDIAGYTSDPPAVASVEILDVIAPAPSASTTKATVDILDVVASQPTPMLQELMRWDFGSGLQWYPEDSFLWWDTGTGASWIPSPGNA